MTQYVIYWIASQVIYANTREWRMHTKIHWPTTIYRHWQTRTVERG